MDSRVFEDDETKLKQEATQRKKNMHKKKMEQFFLHKLLKAKRKDLVLQEMTMELEEREVKKEEDIGKGYLNLGQHRNKQKRKSQKKCWFCKRTKHLKYHCPFIRYFLCHRLGHMKASCFMYKGRR